MLCDNCGRAYESLADERICVECASDEKVFFSYQKPEIRDKFIELSCRLSPENLTCDGELSKTAVRRRYRCIMSEWRKLETRIGRKISEDSVFAYEMKQFNKRM